MSWEAFRLSSKSPAELLTVMGPNGVDHLVRDALMACWRSLPEEGRSFAAWRERADQLWQRNMRVWTKIRKPTPEAFFADLATYESDGFFRQALVLTWMMLPRSGGRDFKDTFGIIRRIFDRNVEAWQADHATFTGGKRKPARPPRPAKSAAKARPTATKAKPSKPKAAARRKPPPKKRK